jgi:RNA polymerase sigma factor (sigma-70 family)
VRLVGDIGGFEALLAAAKEGDEAAWAHVFHRYAPKVAGYLRVQGASDVDDLVGDVFHGVFRNIASFTGTEERFRSWIFVIAHHRIVDDRRRRSRDVAESRWDVPEPLSSSDAVDDTEARTFEHLGAEHVLDVCARLAPDQRDVLTLRIVGDLTIEQIADVLGKSPGAVKALQRRGLSTLQKIFSKKGVPL